MRAQFLPSVLPSTLARAERWGSRPVHWSVPEAEGVVPGVLYSAYHWRDVPNPPDAPYTFGDSGGYTVATKGVDLDPAWVLRWQLRNSHVGAVLDVPPARSAGQPVPLGDAEADRRYALESTVLNLRRALPLYLQAREQGSPFRLWGVVHGETVEEMEEWHDRIADLYAFEGEEEGWCFKPFPARKPRGVARCLAFIRERGVRRAHVFGTGGIRAVTVILALGPRTGLEFVTFDASTPVQLGNSWVVLIPDSDGLGWSQSQWDRNHLRETCDCLSCQWLRVDLEEHGEGFDRAYWKHRMVYHNVLITLRVFDALHRVAQVAPDALLRSKLRNREYSRTVRTFEQKRVVGV